MDEQEDETASSNDGAAMDLNWVLPQLGKLLTIVNAEDPKHHRRTCVSIGDSGSGALILAGLSGRFSTIADISNGVMESPWQRTDYLDQIMSTKHRWHDGDLFDDESLRALLAFNGGGRYDFCFMHKGLHHLRLNECEKARVKGHEHSDACVGVFKPEIALGRLFEYADIVIISEFYYVGTDDDKEGVRGGMLSLTELQEALEWLTSKASVTTYNPVRKKLGRLTARNYQKEIGQRLAAVEQISFAATLTRQFRAKERALARV